MKLAAIDIGSNAVRLQICAVLDGGTKPLFKKVEYVRFPVRLGKDVFSMGFIAPEAQEKILKLMMACKLLMELFEVDHYYACATSALRSAANGEEIVQQVLDFTGLFINVIDGQQEALFIDLALKEFIPLQNCLHIDVGGGSTELNLYAEGAKIASESFALGSVRNQQPMDLKKEWLRLENWVLNNTLSLRHDIVALGTGGNISKLHSMAGKKPALPLEVEQLRELKQFIEQHSLQERIHKLQLNPDRADVIVPAAEIYLSIMQWASCPSILVPSVGLKDGLILYLFQKQSGQL